MIKYPVFKPTRRIKYAVLTISRVKNIQGLNLPEYQISSLQTYPEYYICVRLSFQFIFLSKPSNQFQNINFVLTLSIVHIFLSIYLLYTYLPSHSISVSISFYISIYLSIYLSTYLPIYLSIYLSIITSIYLYIYLSIYPTGQGWFPDPNY